MSERTFTVGDAKPDPSLPTHCDHGVSLDDPCEICRDPNVHIANLEWRVVEAAVARHIMLRKRGNLNFFKWEKECYDVNEKFASAVDALIAAREAELKEE